METKNQTPANKETSVGRKPRETVSLVTLNSSDESSRSNSSLADSSHSNIDLIIDPSAGLASPSSVDKKEDDDNDDEPNTWSGSKSSTPSAIFRRRNSTSIYGTPRRQSSFFGSDSAGSVPPIISYEEINAPSNRLESESSEKDNSCVECGSYCGSYSIRSRFGDGGNEIICETCLQKHWQDEVNELIKYKNSLEMGVRELRRYLSTRFLPIVYL